VAFSGFLCVFLCVLGVSAVKGFSWFSSCSGGGKFAGFSRLKVGGG